MEANVALRTHLLSLGYSPAIWSDAELQISVEIDTVRDFDATLAKALAQCASSYLLDYM